MKAIVYDCYREFLSRKVIIAFAVIAVIVALASVGSHMIEIKLQGLSVNSADLGDMLIDPILRGYNLFAYILAFLSVMVTAGLIPSMLSKGTVDFYVSKPLSRSRLLIGKITGIWIVYTAVMTATLMFDFAITCLVYGVFDSGIFAIVLVNAILFFIWLSITAFAGVVSGSAGVTIMIAFLVWIAQKILGLHDLVKDFTSSKPLTYTLDFLYYVFPKTSEISDFARNWAMGDGGSLMPLWSSLLFALVLILFTLRVFNQKSY